MLMEAVVKRQANKQDKDEDDDMDNREVDDDYELLSVLLSTKRASTWGYHFVKNLEWSSSSTEGKEDQQVKSWTSPRRSKYASFLVVIKWLLGKRQKAEVEAHHLVRQHPFSFVAVANLFYILWMKGERMEAAEFLSPLLKLKKHRPDIYQEIMCEELAELGFYYTELGPEFIPDAIAALEEVIHKKPCSYDLKWDWALNLRRLTNARHTWVQPLNDVVTPLLKATELLLELIQDCDKKYPKIRTAAAAELGEILNSCQFDEQLENTVGQRALDAGFDAAKCFDIVMREEDNGGSNLVRAGKYFRYTGQLLKSEKALKKAVAVQDSPKVHHQLALTLKKLALDEKRRAWQNFKQHQRGKKPMFSLKGPRRGMSRQSLGVISRSRLHARDSKMASLERAMKSVVYQFSFTREDKYVGETMHHLNKALMLSHGENSTVSYDLGLMYKALGEYNNALKQFLVIAETNKHPSCVVSAFEHSGLVMLEKCGLEENETQARALQEDGRSMLNMAILIQSHVVQQFREVDNYEIPAVWKSCYTLGQYLQLQQEVEEVSEEDSPVEVWLLRLLRVYADTLPVLTSLQQFTQHVQSPQVLLDKLHKYLRDQRHEDAVLFVHLLRLTQQEKVTETCDSSISLMAHLLAARTKLMKEVKAGHVGSSFNTNMAERYFCWAFEDAHINSKDTKHHKPISVDAGLEASPNTELQHFMDQRVADRSPTETLTAQARRNREDGTRSEDTADRTKHGTARADTIESYSGNLVTDRENLTVGSRKQQKESVTGAQDNQLDQDENAHKEDHKSVDYHMLLVHDPEDPDAARLAKDLQSVLQNMCGLQVHLPEPDCAASLEKATLEAMDSTHQVLFVIGKKETSSELESYMLHANTKLVESAAAGHSATERLPSARMPRVIVSVTLGDPSALPELLQNQPSFPWTSESSFTPHVSGQTSSWVDSVCELFCFLIGLDDKF